MKFKWRYMMTVVGTGAALAMVAPGCVVRAQVRPAHVVDEAPPEPQYENPDPRPGHVWVRGRWEWRGSKWRWKRGHWKRARAGYTWTHGRWERRGNRWHWVEGRWQGGGSGRATVRENDSPPRVVDHRRKDPEPPRVVDHRKKDPEPRKNERVAATPARPKGPTVAPPKPKTRRPAARRGFVWIRGHWEWRDGDWAWINGHWERARRGYHWKPGEWVLQGGIYVWVEGSWVQGGPARPRVRDHRDGQ